MGTRLEPLDIYEALFDDQRFAELPSILASSLNGRSVLIHWHYADGGADVLAGGAGVDTVSSRGLSAMPILISTQNLQCGRSWGQG